MRPAARAIEPLPGEWSLAVLRIEDRRRLVLEGQRSRQRPEGRLEQRQRLRDALHVLGGNLEATRSYDAFPMFHKSSVIPADPAGPASRSNAPLPAPPSPRRSSTAKSSRSAERRRTRG